MLPVQRPPGAAAFGLALAIAAGCHQPTPAAEVIRRFTAPEARQGVAVDARAFYAIGDSAIGKYDKTTGARLGAWKAEAGAGITHLDSGIVVGTEIYCAHSNYPATPMVSSIEVFDADRLVHLRSIALPHLGSATWVDRDDTSWWVTFAHYSGNGGEAGKPSDATRLVRFSQSWEVQQSWAFPTAVVSRWGTMSSSGGVLASPASPAVFYTTGHDAPEIYVVSVPPDGARLRLLDTIPVDSHGQGIALDRAAGLLYSIERKTTEVLVSRLPALTSR